MLAAKNWTSANLSVMGFWNYITLCNWTDFPGANSNDVTTCHINWLVELREQTGMGAFASVSPGGVCIVPIVAWRRGEIFFLWLHISPSWPLVFTDDLSIAGARGWFAGSNLEAVWKPQWAGNKLVLQGYIQTLDTTKNFVRHHPFWAYSWYVYSTILCMLTV